MKILWRIMVDIILLLGMFLLPWWFVAALGVIGFFIFSSFWEGVVFALLIDILYGVPVVFLFGLQTPFALSALVLFILAEFLRKRTVYYL